MKKNTKKDHDSSSSSISGDEFDHSKKIDQRNLTHSLICYFILNKLLIYLSVLNFFNIS